MENRKYFYSLDAIRGIAALLIVVRHTVDFFGGVDFQESYLAVDLFFVLSGFVLGIAYDQRLRTTVSAGRFLVLRLVRLYPLYLIGAATGISAAAWALRHSPQQLHGLSLAAVLSLMMLPAPILNENLYPFVLPAWSLLLELIANTVYGVTAAVLSRRRILGLMAASALGLIAYVIWSWFARGRHITSLNRGWMSRDLLWGILRVLYSFFAGLLIFRIWTSPPWQKRALSKRRARWLLAGVLLGVVGCLTAAPGPKLQLYYDFTVILFGFPLLVGLAVLCEEAASGIRLFSFLGAVSYGVYVLHLPTADLVRALLGRHRSAIGRHAPWSGLVLLTFVVSLSWLLEKWVDLPVRRYFGKRVGGKPAASERGRSAMSTVS